MLPQPLCQPTPTRSPTWKPATASPMAATRPTTSWPGMWGVVAGRAVSDHGVAVAHAAGLHLNEHLVLVDGGHGHLLSHNRARARKRSGAAPIPQRSLGPKAPPL